MKHADQEIIRKVFSNVLDRLEAENSREAVDAQRRLDGPPSSEAGPVFFIILNNSGPKPDNIGPGVAQAYGEASKFLETAPAGTNPARIPHPGHERFASVEEKSDSLAPKKCFMEPDRACVNSGACEMRGF